MLNKNKPILQALRGEILPVPPVWMMRQAGRYLPEYKRIRARANDFLTLCYTPDLATEVSLQPIRRYGFDAVILFADILLVPHGLGAQLCFIEGKGPRLSTIRSLADFAQLRAADSIHETVSPIYQTIRNLHQALPDNVALIGFAGAPWTVATYMIAGRGSIDQAQALKLMRKEPDVFDALIERITAATIGYLLAQIEAGIEVVQIFDSWAGALKGIAFNKYVIAPMVRIVTALRQAYPKIFQIGFPRGATLDGYLNYAKLTQVDCLGLSSDVDIHWAAKHIQPLVCIQGNLDQRLLVSGGHRLTLETRRIVNVFKNGAHIFNLGHGITPDANPAHVDIMLQAIRS